MACVAASLRCVDFLLTDTTSSFSIIFNNGASIVISFDESDFIGRIHILADHELSVLTNGLNIKDICTVKWKFRAKGRILTRVFFCHYVPGSNTRLSIP